jgi:signal transduction histidine kinase
MILIASDTLGGEFVRKTFQSLLISIPVSAILIKLGQTCGFYDSTYCLYFNLLMNLIIFIGLTWYIAGELAQVDLARRKVEQKNQKDLQETQEQMKIRKDLVAIVSHDLRNPLSAMLMNSDILRRITLDPLKNSEIKAAQIKKIEHNIRFITERMYHLVVNLLDFNKIQTDTYRVEKKPFSSETLLNGVLEMFSAIGSQKNIQVQIDESREVATTYCDFEKIMQVFSNVVGNAMKFTASGGSVSLSVKKEENGVVFFVQDTGIGIPENQIKNIRFSYL